MFLFTSFLPELLHCIFSVLLDQQIFQICFFLPLRSKEKQREAKKGKENKETYAKRRKEKQSQSKAIKINNENNKNSIKKCLPIMMATAVLC